MFLGQARRISVLIEARRGATGFWYAYRTHQRHTRKRYLGRAAQVPLARLEEVARELASEFSPPLAQAKTLPSSEQSGALPSGKLSPPRLPLSLVERSRWLGELDAVDAHPLTLVSAPAGSGKTTLLSAWAAGREPALAWLSLEALDDEPIRFWTAVIAALRTCLPKVGKTAFAMLHLQEAPPLTTILTHLLNEIGQVRRELILPVQNRSPLQGCVQQSRFQRDL